MPPDSTTTPNDADKKDLTSDRSKVKFEVYGSEMVEKKVNSSGNSGRIYLPPNWVGRNVKIIRVD
jgi:hypothetical protein